MNFKCDHCGNITLDEKSKLIFNMLQKSKSVKEISKITGMSTVLVCYYLKKLRQIDLIEYDVKTGKLKAVQ